MTYQPNPNPLVELVRQSMAHAAANMAIEPGRFLEAINSQSGSVIAELSIFQEMAENFVDMRRDLLADALMEFTKWIYSDKGDDEIAEFVDEFLRRQREGLL